MRKSRGGLRKQKAKVFAASLRSFPAIIQAKENWTKVVKKTWSDHYCSAASSSPHIWPSRCVFRKKPRSWRMAYCTQNFAVQNTLAAGLLCFLWWWLPASLVIFTQSHTTWIYRTYCLCMKRSLKSQEQFVTHQPSFCSSQLSTKASKR